MRPTAYRSMANLCMQRDIIQNQQRKNNNQTELGRQSNLYITSAYITCRITYNIWFVL